MLRRAVLFVAFLSTPFSLAYGQGFQYISPPVLGFLAPTLGSTSIASGSTNTALAGLALTNSTINGNTITSGTGTLTLGAGKTFTANNTLTLTATDGSTLAIGAGGALGSNAYTSTVYAPLNAPVFTGIPRVGDSTGIPFDATAMTFVGDTANQGQLSIFGATNKNKFASFGFNTTGNYTFIRSGISGTSWNPIVLDDVGTSNVLIGTTTDAGQKLQVNGLVATNSKTIAGTNSYQAQPADPTGTASGSFVMMGLAGTITPATTGKVLIIISGNITNNTATMDALTHLSYGTGTAPTNGAAGTGTLIGNYQRATKVVAGSPKVPFTVQAIVSGLTLSTAYWIDLNLAALGGGSSVATVFDLSISAHEM